MACASSRSLARHAVGPFSHASVSVSDRVTSLGSGPAAGRRRNMLQARERLKAFRARRGRFQMLKRCGVKTDRLLRTGGISVLTFGQHALGVSVTMLRQQIRANVKHPTPTPPQLT